MLKIKTFNLKRRLPTCYLLSSKVILSLAIVLSVYFIAMDIKLFHSAKNRGPFSAIKSTKNSSKLSLEETKPKKYSLFWPLPVKKIMMAEATHYIRSPLAEFVEHRLGFSYLFPFISANFISITHCILSLVTIKFLMHDSLFWRQIGVGIFQFRNFLDSFDGVIFRAHANKTAYTSHYGSLGYYVDAFSDVFGGICLVGSIALHLLKNRPPKKSLTRCFRLADDLVESGSNIEKSALTRSTSSDDLYNNSTINSNLRNKVPKEGIHATKITILTSVALLGIRIAVSAFFWDKSVRVYQDLLDSPAVSELHQRLQVKILSSTFTILIMIMWRIMCALSLQDMILTAIFLDKTWEFVVKSQIGGWIVLIILVILTELHIAEVRSIL